MKEQRMWAVVDPQGKIICVRHSKGEAWRKAAGWSAWFAMEYNGYRCVRVTVREEQPC